MFLQILVSILDYVPCILFFVATMRFQKILYSLMNKYSLGMLICGSFMVLVGGVLKATWKIFYYSSNGLIDLFKLNHQMFPVLAIGYFFSFLAILISLIDHYRRKNKNIIKVNTFVPLSLLALVGTMTQYVGQNEEDPAFLVYLILLIIGTLGFYTVVAYICFRIKKPGSAVLVILAAVSALGMAYLATKFEGGNVLLNLLAEGVNSVGQLLFLIAVYQMDKGGSRLMKKVLSDSDKQLENE